MERVEVSLVGGLKTEFCVGNSYRAIHTMLEEYGINEFSEYPVHDIEERGNDIRLKITNDNDEEVWIPHWLLRGERIG